MPFCYYCGSREPEGMAFCSSCGQSMTIPSATITSNTTLQPNTFTQDELDPKHLMNTPRIVSKIEEKRSVTLAPLKAELHDYAGNDRYHRYNGFQQRYRHYVASHSGTGATTDTGLVIKAVVLIAIVVGAIIAVPYFIHLGKSPTIFSANATATAVANLPGTVREFPLSVSDGYEGTLYPDGITSGPDGNLWFTESVVSKIGRITPNGRITDFLPLQLTALLRRSRQARTAISGLRRVLRTR